jgi:hypothetical protein
MDIVRTVWTPLNDWPGQLSDKPVYRTFGFAFADWWRVRLLIKCGVEMWRVGLGLACLFPALSSAGASFEMADAASGTS